MELEVCLLHVCSLKVRGGGGREVRERGERRGERGEGRRGSESLSACLNTYLPILL